MYYNNYLKYVLDHNEYVFVDTSTLMHVDSMRLFLEKAEEVFIDRDKKMILTQWVLRELNKHKCSENLEIKSKAEDALKLINDFKELFIIEHENSVEHEATFADSDFLSKLILNKARASQLLITPDKDLALDAFNLNNQNSNRGFRIMVCHINRAGYIKKCDCADKNIYEPKIEAKKSEVIVKEKIVYKDSPAEASDNKKNYAAIAGGIAGGFVGGVLFDKYAIPMIRKAIIAA